MDLDCCSLLFSILSDVFECGASSVLECTVFEAFFAQTFLWVVVLSYLYVVTCPSVHLFVSHQAETQTGQVL